MGKHLGFAWFALTLASGCTGLIGTGDGDGAGGPNGVGPNGQQIPLECSLEIPQAGAERILRLTPEQYANSVRVLLNDENLDPSIDADRESIATLNAVRKWYDAADAVIPTGTAWMSTYASCDVSGDENCAAEFYAAFATRAFRRPLLDDEKAWLDEAWAALPADAPLVERLQTMAELVLQAPEFLYIYFGEGAPVEDSPHGLLSLTGYERAQRLSFFLWNSLPDQSLLDAAANGDLDTPEGVRTQAERMLMDDRVKPVLRSFLAEWLELNGAAILPSLGQSPKDSELFPAMNDSLRAAMRTEIEAFMEYVMFEKDGSMEALFTDTRAYVNGPLAELYGVSNGPTGANEWKWVDLDPSERAGMLTRAGFLTVHAGQTATSPIRRGVYMLRNVLCYDIPPPPANVDNSPVEATDLDEGGVLTVRKQTEIRTSPGSCAGCHNEINGLGFAFEHYDAIGAWQDEEAVTGGDIDASANLSHAGAEFDGPVDGAVKLSEKLAMSPAVAQCATEKWFQVAVRRSPVPLDDCAVASVRDTVSSSGSIRELLLAIITSDAFLNVNHGPTDTEEAASP
ncbi:MAG: DUF1592 domain-containing protein [Polyangiales bacterium]